MWVTFRSWKNRFVLKTPEGMRLRQHLHSRLLTSRTVGKSICVVVKPISAWISDSRNRKALHCRRHHRHVGGRHGVGARRNGQHSGISETPSTSRKTMGESGKGEAGWGRQIGDVNIYC